MDAAHFLQINRVSKVFDGNVKAVDDVTLGIARGRMLGLLGPSGCGKTTLLRIIAGLGPSTSGSIFVDGKDITHVPVHQRDVGFVFQNYALFPHLTVIDNVLFGLQMRKLPRAESMARVEEAMRLVRMPMEKFGQRKPRALSGGQQQRVALARALAIRPSLLLLDEPLSNLDAKLRDEMRLEISEIQKTLGITAVFVTHDQAEAMSICDEVGVMSAGRLIQLGNPFDIYENPASLEIARFVGRINEMQGTMQDDRRALVAGHAFHCANAGDRAGSVTIAVRPHRIVISPMRDTTMLSVDTNKVAGRIARTVYEGDSLSYEVQCEGLRLTVEMPTRSATQVFPVDTQVMCEWSAQDTRVFA